MLRGANRQEIFHDDEDCQRFVETLERYKKKNEVKVHGWCLMGNHVHLLLKEGKEPLAATMKRIGVSSAWFYNWKYKTTGHLFQDRYKSEKVENDEYLLAVVRYIHQNPLKAEMVKSPEEYKWSSCKEYYDKPSNLPSLLDRELVLEIFSGDRKVAVEKFREYNEAENGDRFLDDAVKTRLTDEEARTQISKVTGGYGIAKIKSLPKGQRDEIVAKIKGIEGLTQRQISRILGISLSLINRA
jgi:REP element-mobilizing transposase RayT